ncbi:MAG: hypothetical protein RR048_07620 [Oscillospiraceae bacterium]
MENKNWLQFEQTGSIYDYLCYKQEEMEDPQAKKSTLKNQNSETKTYTNFNDISFKG